MFIIYYYYYCYIYKKIFKACEIIFVSNPSFNTNERTINSKYELKDIIGRYNFE